MLTKADFSETSQIEERIKHALRGVSARLPACRMKYIGGGRARGLVRVAIQEIERISREVEGK